MTTAAFVGHRPDVSSLDLADDPPQRAWKKRAVEWGPLAAAVAFLADKTIAAVLAKVGHAAAVLDDSYIHFQYARAIASGHPFRFQAGAPITSGATSMLWPALLAPFWAVGMRDDAIVWAAWAFSFAALGGLAWEAAKLTERLAGKTAAAGAAAMTLAFGGFLWSAASGMEVVPFAWAIARGVRKASAWAERSNGGDERRLAKGGWGGASASSPMERRRDIVELTALAWVAALFRPEGALTALFIAATFALFPHQGKVKERALALPAVAAVIALPLLLWALTGSPRSNTAIAKLLPGNPYYEGPALIAAVSANARLLIGTLLNGDTYSAEFLPRGGAPLAMAGLGAIGILGLRTGARWRAAGVLLIALTMFAPCFYYTFLWNRLRYLWPFATGWIIGLACLARLVGDAAGVVRPRWRIATGLVCGAIVGLFASKLGWVIDDVAQSASGIDRQQVALGRWASEALSPTARIGVNDTGAIAYFSERSTFDVVGLTTQGEARYWIAGAGSRLEHYERLYATSPESLPTHFIVYPEWMAMDAVLGEPLKEETVTDASILGGQTMRAYVADWSKLGSGESPWTPSGAGSRVVDAVDVADLESEASHGYELLGAREGEETAHEGVSPDGQAVLDGGRTQRSVDRFRVHLLPGVAARGIVRIDGPSGTHVTVLADQHPVASFDLGDDDDWVERVFDIPAGVGTSRTTIELRADSGAVTTYHYWFLTPD